MPAKRKPKSNTPAGLAEFARQEKKRAEKIAREQAIFQMACLKRGITPTTGPKIFGVSRPTFWGWMHSKHAIPHKVFVRLAELDAQMDPAQWERMQQMKRLAEKMNLNFLAKPRGKGKPAKPIIEDENE